MAVHDRSTPELRHLDFVTRQRARLRPASSLISTTTGAPTAAARTAIRAIMGVSGTGELGATVIHRELQGDIVVVAPAESLEGRRARELRELVAGEVEAGRCRFVLDMTEIEFIDSSGLGALVWSHSRATEAGGAVLLCGVGSRVRSLIALTRLDEVLSIRPGRDVALAELAAGGRPGR